MEAVAILCYEIPMWLILSYLLALAPAQASEPQAEVDAFFREHSIAYSHLFCRTDMAASECRTLIRFTENATGRLACGFQIAFFAPSRQVAATELFLPKDMVFQQFTDKSFDGSFVAEKGGAFAGFCGESEVKLEDWKPAHNIVADLTFTPDQAVIEGYLNQNDGSKAPLKLVYERFHP